MLVDKGKAPCPPRDDQATVWRANRRTTAAPLKAERAVKARELPWEPQPMTAEWWSDVWASPMAPEYDDSDRHGLVMLAVLVDSFWTCPVVAERLKLMAEIRQQSQRFGLSPMDRRRLQWEIERTEDAQAKGARRRAAAPKPDKSSGADPRGVLRAV